MPDVVNPDEQCRFLVTFRKSDLAALDKAAKRRGIPRNRYVILAVNALIKAEPKECPICGRNEDHAH